MKAKVLSLEGKAVSEIELPEAFEAEVDKTLIGRAVQALLTSQVQTKYPYIYSGRYNTAAYVGSRHKPAMYRSINIERARKPKLKNRRGLSSGKVASIPAVVKGPKAHPPKKEKIWAEKINKKENKKAIVASIAATAKADLVKARGHSLPEKLELPIVFESKLEKVSKTKEALKAFQAIGVDKDIERAKSKKTVRAGKGKKRGRKYKERKSLLVVVEKESPLIKAVRNLEGVEVAKVSELNVSLLAPGALPGRLVVWTEGAIKALEGK